MEALRTADEIRDVNTRYHDVAASSYDTKWGIDFGEYRPGAGARQAAQAARAPSSTAATAARLRSAPAPATSASTCSRPASSREATCTDISPGMVEHAAAPTPSGSGCRQDGARRRRVAPVRGRELRPRARPRRAAPPARPAPRLRRVSPGAASRRADRVRRRAVAVRRPAGVDPQAHRRCWWRRSGGRCCARAARPTRQAPDSRNAGRRDHALERFVDIHAFAPGDLERHARRAGFERRRGPRRGAGRRTGSAGSTARSRPAPSPTTCRCCGASYAFRGYLVLQRLDERVLEPLLPPAIFYNLLLTARKG